MRIVRFMYLLLFVCACICLSRAESQAASKVVLSLAYPAPTGSSMALGFERFRQLVESKSSGEVSIQLFGDSRLGSDRRVVESLLAGVLDMGTCSTPNMTFFIPEFGIFDLPYVTSPHKQGQLYAALDSGQLGAKLRAVAMDKDMVILMFSEYGYRSFASSRRPLRGLADLKGLRVRVTDSPVERAVVEALGMIGVPIPWAENLEALELGGVDVTGNTFAHLVDKGHLRVLRYALETSYNYCMELLLMNKASWDSLTAGQKSILQEAAVEALQWQRGENARQEAKALEIFAQANIKVLSLSKAEKEEIKALTRPVFLEHSAKVPAELLQLLLDTQR